MNKKEQELRDVWEKSDKFLKKILYAYCGKLQYS